MSRRKRSVMVLAATATALAVGTLTSGGAARAAGAPSITPVLGGLAAPRGIAFDGQGSMYVAESGTAGSGSAGMTHTGKVDKYRWGRTTPVWSTSFASLYASQDPSAPPDVLGPSGISAVGNGCMKHSQGRRMGCQVRMVTAESTPGILAETDGAVNDPQAGHVFRLDGATGTPTDLADVGTQMWNWTRDHHDVFPDDFPDANPYGVLVTKGEGGIRTFVADAAANTVLEVMRDGTARIIAYIPNEAAPPFRDATPTCIAQGPDGDLYVGTLHFVANLFMPGQNGDQSDVWRIDPDASYPAAPHLWTSGLTTITGCTFDRSGNFWATEMFQGGFGATPPGDVVKVPFSDPSRHTRIGFGQLPVPGGIAQGPDGAMYVTVGSSAPGASGGVMRVAD